MSNVDVLVAVNAADIVTSFAHSIDPSRPTSLGYAQGFIFMLVKNENIAPSDNPLSGNGGSELSLLANQGDNIRFREMSLSNDFDYTVILYSASADAGQVIISPWPPELLGGATANGVPLTIPELVPKQGSPLDPVAINMPYHYWQTTAQAAGTVTYHFSFAIYSRTSLVGYFNWDPFITIQNP